MSALDTIDPHGSCSHTRTASSVNCHLTLPCTIVPSNPPSAARMSAVREDQIDSSWAAPSDICQTHPNAGKLPRSDTKLKADPRLLPSDISPGAQRYRLSRRHESAGFFLHTSAVHSSSSIAFLSYRQLHSVRFTRPQVGFLTAWPAPLFTF